MTKFELLRTVAVVVIVFLALLTAGWLTALWVSGIVAAAMAYAALRRAESAEEVAPPQP